jgi:hypothetical protein
MATIIFLALCLLGEGFMVYVLIQFVREGRRAKMACHPHFRSRTVFMPAEGGYRMPRRRVMHITVLEGRPETLKGAGGHPEIRRRYRLGQDDKAAGSSEGTRWPPTFF